MIRLDSTPHGGRLKVTARREQDTLHLDTLDPANAAQRKRFLKALQEKGATEEELGPLEAGLLALATKDRLANDPTEIDLSAIARPEQILHPLVTGLAIPSPRIVGGEPDAEWMLYLRCATGERECRKLERNLELPDGAALWIHPKPGNPGLASAPAWSLASRRAWLRGDGTVDPSTLFQCLCQALAYYLDLPADVAAGTCATLALWTVLSYVFRAWDAVPYLFVGGPLGSGKSRVFELLSRLVYRPLQSSNLTAPALFRTLNDRGGAVLFDEAERLRQSSPEVQELLSMLLAGHKKGGQATRLEPVGDTFRPVAFDVFGPKALACIAGLPPALASRCIPVTMFRAGPDSEKPKRRLDAQPGLWQELRDALHVLMLDNGPAWLELARRDDVCPHALSGREWEVWQPLLALAAFFEERGAKGLLALLREHALRVTGSAKEDHIPEADETLLELLAEEVQAGRQPSPAELLGRAKERDAISFDRWHPRTVSTRLKTYGIPPPKKSNGERRFRNVSLDALRRVQAHYGLDLGLAEFSRPDPAASSLIVPYAPVPTGPYPARAESTSRPAA